LAQGSSPLVLTLSQHRGSPARLNLDMSTEADVKAPTAFTSRLARKVLESRQDDKVGMLWTVCLFAALAECVNSLVMPLLVFRGVDATGTFCNFSGAWIGGFALACGNLGPRCNTLSTAFRGGFVAAYTSFIHVVEHSVALHCGRKADSASMVYLAVSLIGGPIFFHLGRRMGAAVFVWRKEASSEKDSNESTDASATVLARTRYVLHALLVLALSCAAAQNGRDGALELTVGVLLTVAACQVGDMVTGFWYLFLDIVNEHIPDASSVNWGTIFANVSALLLVVMCEYSQNLHSSVLSKMPPDSSWFLALFAVKFRGSFCGALSAYGGFSEDTFGMLAQKNPDAFAANLGMNGVAAVTALALLSHASCPFGDA